MTNIQWQLNTGIDLFVSLRVIQFPEKGGVRASWAAGVRSRLAPESRDTLALTADILPIGWLYGLPEPRSGTAVLDRLAALPAAERLPMLLQEGKLHTLPVQAVLDRVLAQGGWTQGDVDLIKEHLRGKRVERGALETALELWAQAPELGDRYLDALYDYTTEFYAEEEQRIRPVLSAAVEEGQEDAQTLSLDALFEKLSHGIDYQAVVEPRRVVFAPSFWTTPLVIDLLLPDETLFFIYGAKPPTMSFVPGEVVPDDLHQALKALADPTRLKILRLLSQEPMAPSELAKALRLRPATLTHHLQILRLARLVRFTLSEADRRLYTIRVAGIDQMVELLGAFLDGGGEA